jgi:hypothetical protein
MNRQRTLSALALALACLCLLAACGGGGGGGGPKDSVPLPPSSVEISLIPAVGVTGEVLYADAAPLRVLRPGATWTYRGTDQPRGAAAPDTITYANKVGFATDAQGHVEQSTNLFNEGSDLTGGMRFEGGAWVYGVLIDMMTGSPALAATLAELRSPVRAGDLYGFFERSNIDTGSDLDGDRLNETAQVAVYSRVVAKETLDLPNRSGVEAVRVDMTMRMRLTPTKTRVPTPVYEAVQSTWYAPGIGVVKRRLDEPNSINGLPNRIVTEVLENWDGLTEGLGYAPTRTAAAPASSPVAASALQYPETAVAFDTHVVVTGRLPNTASALGIMLAQLDPQGTMVAARNYAMAELFPGADYVNEARLVRSGDELRLFARVSNRSVAMVALDATGQRVLRPPVTVLTDAASNYDYDRSSYRVVADGPNFWIAWMRITQEADGRYLSSAQVIRVDGNGQPQTAPHAGPLMVIEPVAADIHNFSMAVDGKRVGLSWYQGNLPTISRRVVMIDSGSMALSRRTLDLPPEACLGASMVSMQPGLGITCLGNAQAAGAARFDANGELVLAKGPSLAGETLQAPWLTRVNGGAQVTGGAGELTFVASQYAPYWPGEIDTGFTTVLRTNSAGGALAAREPLLLARIPGGLGTVMSTVQFGNRLLLLSGDRNGNLATTLVWLPK